MALLDEALGNIDVATQNFDKAESLYELALEGSYDEMYLDFIVKASHFYAQNNQKEKALNMAKKAYKYVKDNQVITTSFEIQQSLNLAELYYELGDYQLALTQSNATLELLKKTLPTQTTVKNSTVIFKYKPLAILYKVKSEYQLQSKKEVPFLKEQFKEINLAIAIIEQQKTLISGDTNVSIMIENSTQVFEFGKKIALQLYEATNDKNYLNKMIGLNESVLYNKIRARLNSRSAMAYHNVPKNIIDQEKKLQVALQKSLLKNDDMKQYFKLENDWNNYLKMLQLKYPKYYKLQFASISKSVENLTENLPENVTVVRYSYIDKQLYAIVISKENTLLFKINQEKLADNIKKLQQDNPLFETQFDVMHDLYVQLWKPLEKSIKTENVVIVPDRDLFNLSFEMLTPKLAKSYQELTTNSLLAKYVISYNYSLFLIDKNSKTVDYEANFVAFVPEFNDKMKKDYKIAIHDSMSFDKAYLTLLPQPFTKSLAENATHLFSGTSFLNENSTEHIFKNSAKEHKIIHIGTHAESNNITPELSRLMFAKSTDTLSSDDNYLYTYEIYNTNLSSNLAILTACETGKPTYQAGEGMISLAHAFNYAGSESILTSLWKIDEQSSAEIIALFYENIKKGWAKDKALQQAKLDYMATAKGRTINPQYWAGLVLIGDTSPIELQSSYTFMFLLLGLLAVAFAVVFIRKRKNKLQH
jgi:CHAT domain-containing protein